MCIRVSRVHDLQPRNIACDTFGALKLQGRGQLLVHLWDTATGLAQTLQLAPVMRPARARWCPPLQRDSALRIELSHTVIKLLHNGCQLSRFGCL